MPDEKEIQSVFARFGFENPNEFPDASRALDWVAADLIAGFTVDLPNGTRGPAFAIDRTAKQAIRRADFADESVGSALHVDDELSVVPWEFDCVHVGSFQTLPPTGRSFTMRGTTFISRESPTGPPRGDGVEREVVARRYINWMDVVADLDIAVSYRHVRAAEWPTEPPEGVELG